MGEETDAAAEDESGGGARVAPDRRGDSTESSGGGADVGEDGGGDDDAAGTATSPIPSADSGSDSAADRDEDLERAAPPPVSGRAWRARGGYNGENSKIGELTKNQPSRDQPKERTLCPDGLLLLL